MTWTRIAQLLRRGGERLRVERREEVRRTSATERSACWSTSAESSTPCTFQVIVLAVDLDLRHAESSDTCPSVPRPPGCRTICPIRAARDAVRDAEGRPGTRRRSRRPAAIGALLHRARRGRAAPCRRRAAIAKTAVCVDLVGDRGLRFPSIDATRIATIGVSSISLRARADDGIDSRLPTSPARRRTRRIGARLAERRSSDTRTLYCTCRAFHRGTRRNPEPKHDGSAF